MKNWSPTQHACLDALGIDVWVPRAEQVESAEKIELEVETVQVVNAVEATAIQNTETAEVKISPTEIPETILSPIEPELVPETPPVFKTDSETTPELAPKIVPDIPADWNGLQQAVSNCQRCTLSSSRTNTVFGSGNQNANWLIIGDTPTIEDDQKGNPFTGQSGELLSAMLRAIKLTRQQVYITNTLKCTTPNNREPEELEIATCLQYLHQQIMLIKPKLILVMGQSAAQRVLNTHSTLARLRQKIHTLEGSNIPVIVTYHPASLLSMPANKGKAWQDLQFAQKTISTEDVL